MHAPDPTTFEQWKLVLLTPWSRAAIGLAGAAVLASLGLTAWGYRQRRPAVRWLLLGLRAAAAACLLLLVLQPAVQLRSVTRVPNHVAIVVDASRSMGIRDRRGGATRLERAKALLKRSAARLSGWRRQRLVDLYSFSDRLRPDVGAALDGLRAAGPATRVRAALEEVRELHGEGDLAGVVLVSDGNDNGRFGSERLAGAARRFVERLGAPVHTVWIGAEVTRDVAIGTIWSDDFAFVRNAVKIEAELLASGVRERRIPVRLKLGDRVVAERIVRVDPDRSRRRVRFEIVPQRVGDFVYTVEAPLYAGEALKHNNARSFLLKVIRDRVRVLQVCGRPSWDERFLRRLLKRDPNVDLISFFILRTPASLSLVPPSELSLIPFPTKELFERELGSFDLVILQNFNYGPYSIGAYLPQLKRYVEQGGGLAMVGGDLSFSSGGYAGTPVADVLPVLLLPAGPPARLISEEPFRPRLTASGKDHPIFQLGRTREQTEKLLAALPELLGVNRVAGAAPGATVLAVHPRLSVAGGAPMPVIAAREHGKGRTLALTTDTLWRWAFLGVDAGGSRQAYDRFWHNAIRWLIKDPELKYLRVIGPRSGRVRVKSAARISIRAYNPDYSPARGLEVEWEIAPLRRGVALARRGRTDGEGELGIDFRPPAAGAYRARATATIGGRRTTESTLFVAESAGAEDRDPRAVKRLLEQLAAASGGRYLGQARSLPELPFRQPRVLRVNWQRDVELWNSWWSLLAAVALFALEWIARRRFGHL